MIPKLDSHFTNTCPEEFKKIRIGHHSMLQNDDAIYDNKFIKYETLNFTDFHLICANLYNRVKIRINESKSLHRSHFTFRSTNQETLPFQLKNSLYSSWFNQNEIPFKRK
jgi:hypothetical protein